MRDDMELEDAYNAVQGQLNESIRRYADAIATDFQLSNVDTLATLMARAVRRWMPGNGVSDRRTKPFRCRFRIYDMLNHPDEPYADTGEGTPVDTPGSDEWIIDGLPAVATMAVSLARKAHGPVQFHGLSSEDLARGLRGIRPTLSRRGGNAKWRLEYDTEETFSEHTQKRGWLMRVDIIREESK